MKIKQVFRRKMYLLEKYTIKNYLINSRLIFECEESEKGKQVLIFIKISLQIGIFAIKVLFYSRSNLFCCPFSDYSFDASLCVLQHTILG